MIADKSPLREMPPADTSRLSFVPCDLGSADWDALLSDGDVIHHYACTTVPETANNDPLGDLDGNVRATVRLLETLRKKRGTRTIFPSSGGTVYGRLRKSPVSEDHPLDPITVYGVSKVAIEKYFGFYRNIHGLDLRVARLSNPYGIGQNPLGKQGAVTTFFDLAMRDQPIEIWGDGSVVRDYIHISDAVDGLLAVLNAPLEGWNDQPVFNIGSGAGTSLREILTVLEERLGRKLNVRYLPGRRFDVPSSVLDIGRARATLGWAPKLAFSAGMDLMMSDYRAKQTAYSTLLPA